MLIRVIVRILLGFVRDVFKLYIEKKIGLIFWGKDAYKTRRIQNFSIFAIFWAIFLANQNNGTDSIWLVGIIRAMFLAGIFQNIFFEGTKMT